MSRYANTALRIEDSDFGFERSFVLIEGGLNSKTQQNMREKASWQHIAAFVCAIVIVVVASAACGIRHTLSVEHALNTCQTQEVRVLPGQTMWALAQEYHVDGVSDDELVSWMRDVNDLDSVLLMPGQRLIVPQGHQS